MIVGLAQMNIIWENKNLNKEKCLDFFKKAKNNNIDMLVFPEMTLTGFSMNVKEHGDRNNETVTWFKKQCKIYNINAVFGYAANINGMGENHLSIVSKKGCEILNYTKIHPFSYGDETKYYQGGQSITSTIIEGIHTVPFICYDLRFPEIFQIASKVAEFIIVIANWPKDRRDHWITLLKARAIENQCFIAGVNRVGSTKTLYYSGDSLIIDPLGNILAQGNDCECLLTSEINSKQVINIREGFRVKNDRKEDLYASYFLKKGIYNKNVY